MGHYDALVRGDDGGDASGAPPVVATMEELLEVVRGGGGAGAYEWLPAAAQEGLVQLLAATVLRAPGKVKPALEHVAKGGCR
jgi:hypothetical protein